MKDLTKSILAQFTDPASINIELREQIARYELICERTGNTVAHQVLLGICSQYDLPSVAVVIDEPQEPEQEEVAETVEVDAAVDRMAKARAAKKAKAEAVEPVSAEA